MAVVVFGLSRNNMIIIRIHGGLGNQMFQYALGRNLSLIHGVPFKIDTSYLRTENQSGRSFLLDNFTTQCIEANPEEIQKHRSGWAKIIGKYVREKSPRFDPSILKRSDGYFDGHWNSEKYFKTSESVIRTDTCLKKPFDQSAEKIAREIAATEIPVSIHIRRGDYVSIAKIATRHGILPLSYYKEAMDKVAEKFPNAHFFIFSDDIAWTQGHFPKKYPLTFISDPSISACESLILMSKCVHHIIANSTYSWWGAWLNASTSKIVIAPEAWMNDPSIDTRDILPDPWIQL
jgi:hypothetical protein